MLEPYLQPEFKSYGVSDMVVGLLFSVMCVAYAIPLFFLCFIPEYWDRRALIGISCILSVVTLFPIGPIFFNKNIIILIIGLALFGATGSFGIIPSVSDNQIGIKEKYQQATDSQISNQVAGITNLALSFPKVIGPPIGGFILDCSDSFKVLVFIDCLMMLATGLIYIPLSEPYKAYSSFKKRSPKDESKEASAI